MIFPRTLLMASRNFRRSMYVQYYIFHDFSNYIENREFSFFQFFCYTSFKKINRFDMTRKFAYNVNIFSKQISHKGCCNSLLWKNLVTAVFFAVSRTLSPTFTHYLSRSINLTLSLICVLHSKEL